jgi:PIN domain nuclease of toxin-antitoxin system
MRILLDTNVLLWAVGRSRRLDPETIDVLSDASNDVLFSAASIWEIAIKFALKRADFDAAPHDVLQGAVAIGFVELAVTAATAATVAKLPLIHRDPFDRLLIAQAIAEPAMLYTADSRLPAYSELVRRIGTR